MARKSRKHLLQNEYVPEVKSYAYLVGEYLRLSDEDERDDEETSIGNQDKICKDYLSRESNVTLVDTYIDNGRTGTNFHRPGFERLLADLKCGKINCIIVKDLSRFGRNFLETSEFIEKIFPEMGVRFIAVNNNYDSIKVLIAEDGISIPFSNMTNEIYAKDISNKINASIQTMVANEEFLPSASSIPFGYLRDEEEKTYCVDWENAFVVKMIFEWRALGYSLKKIADTLNSKGIKCPGRVRYDRGMNKSEVYKNAYWLRGTVRKILRSEVYIGHRIYGTVRKEKFGAKKKRQPKEKWVYAYYKHPALVSEELFDRVQVLMDEADNERRSFQKRETVSKEERELFQKKVYCGDCGSPMGAGKRLQRVTSDLPPAVFYQCNRYTDTGHIVCSNHYIAQSTLLSAVKNAIGLEIQLVFEADRFLHDEELKKTVEWKKGNIRKEIYGISARLAENDNRLEHILMDYNDGVINLDEFQYMKQKYSTNRTEWSKEKAMLEKKLAGLENRGRGIESWVKLLMNFHKNGVLDRRMVDALIEKIVVYEDKQIEIEFSFCDELSRFVEDFRKEVLEYEKAAI